MQGGLVSLVHSRLVKYRKGLRRTLLCAGQRSNARIRDISVASKNAAEWWIKFLSLALAFKLSVERSTRETVWAWTDACGEAGGLAAVVCSLGNWYCTALVVPGSVTSQLLAPR